MKSDLQSGYLSALGNLSDAGVSRPRKHLFRRITILSELSMNALPAQQLLPGNRLIGVLAELAVLDGNCSERQFTERLGSLVDFGDSMRLAGLLDGLGKQPFESAPASRESLREELLRLRLSLVQSVVDSFAGGADTKIKLPTSDPEVAREKLFGFEPYHRFYAAHQRNAEYKIQSLQLKLRDAVAGVSPELARLVGLDEGLRDLLAAHVRRSLASIPKLLGRRFEILLREAGELGGHDDQIDEERIKMWTRPDGWLQRFYQDMQGLLLAELELRFVPMMGLLDALDEAGRK